MKATDILYSLMCVRVSSQFAYRLYADKSLVLHTLDSFFIQLTLMNKLLINFSSNKIVCDHLNVTVIII